MEPLPPTPPEFPRVLRNVLTLVPRAVHSTLLAVTLNQVFRRPLQAGDLAFFENRVLDIEVRDAGLRYRITMRDGRFRPQGGARAPEVNFSGSVYDFMVLAARHADPDTLFFQRRLRLSGDTELGLHLKNFLAALDPDDIPAIIAALSPVLLGTYETLFARRRGARD